MQNGFTRRVCQVLTAVLLSVLLMLPTAVKWVHDFLEQHAHELCAAELDGEVHFHPVEQECHFQPVFISPYHTVHPVISSEIEVDEPSYTQAIPGMGGTAQPLFVSLRGPPAA